MTINSVLVVSHACKRRVIQQIITLLVNKLQFLLKRQKLPWMVMLHLILFDIAPTIRAPIVPHVQPLKLTKPMKLMAANRQLYNPILYLHILFPKLFITDTTVFISTLTLTIHLKLIVYNLTLKVR